MLLTFNSNSVSFFFFIHSLCIFSYFVAATNESVTVVKDGSFTEVTLDTAHCWSEIYSIPNEGFDIFNSMKPPPCPNQFVPPALIEVSELKNCIPMKLLKKICPAHGKQFIVTEMGYTELLGFKNGDEAAKSWIRLSTVYHAGATFVGIFKLCSIEVNSVPHIGVEMAAGMLNPNDFVGAPCPKTGLGKYCIEVCPT